MTILDLTKSDVNFDEINWVEVTGIKFPVVKVLPMRGSLATDFDGTLQGHRYGASPHLNVEKYSDLIESLFELDDELLAQIDRGMERVIKSIPTNETYKAHSDLVEKGEKEPLKTVAEFTASAALIESSGGSPSESYALAEKLRRTAKLSNMPLYTFSEQIAASGGYFLLSAGDEAYASPLADIGSIGVVTELEKLNWWGRLWNKIDFRFLTAGAKKRNNLYNPFIKHSKEDEETVMGELRDIHSVFIDYVKARRGDKITVPDDEVFTGECWLGKNALNLGLIDGVGLMEDVLYEKYGPALLICEVGVTDAALLADAMGGIAGMMIPPEEQPKEPEATYKPHFSYSSPKHIKINRKFFTNYD